MAPTKHLKKNMTILDVAYDGMVDKFQLSRLDLTPLIGLVERSSNLAKGNKERLGK
jgi:hypothetical protein